MVRVPTIKRINGYRMFPYSNEGAEPAHVHIERAEHSAKFWLDAIELAGKSSFPTHELARIFDLVAVHRVAIKEAWNEYFRR